MTAGIFYFSFVAIYLAHMQEEYWNGFTRKLPPPRLAGTFAERGFWVLNPFLLSFATAVGVAALWASICLWNAASHGIWSLATHAYQPGLISGLLYALLFAVWAWLLHAQGNTDWAAFWLALLIGFIISTALGSFAYIGRRVFK